MSTVRHVSADTFDREVLRSEVPVVVDFYATWCMPCRMLAPVLEKLAVELDGRVKVLKLDVDEEPLLASREGISAVPTLKLYRGGLVRETIQGLVRPGTLKSKLEALADEGAPAVGV